MFTNTIAAISTPLAEGAISIVRLSGADALTIANKIIKKDISTLSANTITLQTVQDECGTPVDQVLLSVFKAPRSYTGEDLIEINCHGGVYVTRKVLELLLSAGADLAKPGEFTQRAFINGRIDLTQAEAVEDMVEASNDNAVTLAAAGIRGSVKKLLDPLIDDLEQIIAQIEVNIDYPEYEDVEELTEEKLLPMTEDFLKDIDRILSRAHTGQLARSGINTVILGRPNVGKSSLLNCLLEEDKAIVTDIPGTTRDIVEGRIRLRDLQLNLVDTAGIRQTDDVVEKIGVEKSLEQAKNADLVIVLLDASAGMNDEDARLLEAVKDKTHLVVWNKSDLKAHGGLSISAAKGEIEPLIEAISKMYDTSVLHMEPVMTNERQIGLLSQAKRAMERARASLEAGMSPDLAAVDMQEAWRCLKEILGEVSREDLLDTLFSRFCLGK